MPPRGLFIFAIAAAALFACALLGGASSRVAVAFYSFALMIGGPIAILAWFGSVSDLDEKSRERRRRLKSERSDALLWQDTLLELQGAAWQLDPPLVVDEADATSAKEKSPPLDLWPDVASARARCFRSLKRIKRSILALLLAATAGVGISGCGVPPEAWAAVQPGMSTAQLVSIVGGPDYVRSNGTGEVWQYCRDFPGRDEGRWARYYTAVLVDKQTVKDVRPYPALSDAGCEDYYRANF